MSVRDDLERGDGTYDPVSFGEDEEWGPYDWDELCPDCCGDGVEDVGGTCLGCGGSGWLPAS